MTPLNFHHLRYFWMVAREENLTRASRRLGVAPSTVSTQVRTLAESMGHPLFVRQGRALILSPHGEVVKQYADEIFSLGRELEDAVRGVGAPRHAQRLRVGVSSHLPKRVAYRLLSPVLNLSNHPVHMVCRQDAAESLVADLAVHHLDVVLSDVPVGLASDLPLESRFLMDCSVSIMGTPALYRRYKDGFPASLDGAPLLLPDQSSAMRRLIEDWFDRTRLRPRVIGEFDDSALMKSFGQEGAGLFPIPSLVQEEVSAQYGVSRLGELEGPRERFFAVAQPGRFDVLPLKAIVDAVESMENSP